MIVNTLHAILRARISHWVPEIETYESFDSHAIGVWDAKRRLRITMIDRIDVMSFPTPISLKNIFDPIDQYCTCLDIWEGRQQVIWS